MARLVQKALEHAVMPWACVVFGHDWIVGGTYAWCGRAGCSFEAIR